MQYRTWNVEAKQTKIHFDDEIESKSIAKKPLRIHEGS